MTAIADAGNNRVTLYNYFLNSSGASASIVVGQPDFYQNPANNTPGATGTASAQSLNDPGGASIVGRELLVTDGGNNRILIWTSFPSYMQQPADFVLGQTSMTANSINSGQGAIVSAGGFNSPNYPATDGVHYLVEDTGNSRVLIWSKVPTQTQALPNVVLGQQSMNVGTANTPNITVGLFAPQGIATDGSHIVIGDRANNRVLIWNGFPTSNGQQASVVLGQPNFSTNLVNGGGVSPSSQTLSHPKGVTLLNGKLVVCDDGNFRVLIWNSIPTVNQQPADIVIGQPDMVSYTPNNTPGAAGTASAMSINDAPYTFNDGTRLFINDYGNNRVLIWNSVPIQNQQSADLVIGQPNMVTTSGSSSPTTLTAPLAGASNNGIFGVNVPSGY